MTDAYAPFSSKPNPAPDKPVGICQMPVPDDAPPARLEHHKLGKPVKDWWYYDAQDRLLGIACRYIEADGNKSTRLWTCWRINNKLRWQCRHWPKPKPLYGLNRLAKDSTAPIVICEGEKATDAAAILLPTHIAMCWPGGANAVTAANFEPLANRQIMLWPDNDDTGNTAMATAAEALTQLQAKVHMLNLGALSAYLASGCAGTHAPSLLKPKDDAADLISREAWTNKTMAAFLSLPGSTMEPIAIPKEAKTYNALIEAMEHWLDKEHLDVNATGRWMRNGIPALASGELHDDCIHNLRLRMSVNAQKAEKVFSQIAKSRTLDQYESIVSGVCGRPVTQEAIFELVNWIELICPDNHEGREGLFFKSIQHWIWLVKRSALGLPRQHDIMPIIYSQVQGNGKSTALQRLCSPLAELTETINAEVLTDSRRATELESHLIGIWDEMEGADKKDLTEIKSAITCYERSYRILGTHRTAKIVRRMNFIGTSNRPVSQIFRDTTGARRYLEIPCHNELNWDRINAIDYDLLWSCVSEHDPAPISSMLNVLKDHQQEIKFGDSVTMWLEDFREGGLGQFSWEVLPGQLETVPKYNPDLGETGEQVRLRYTYWCRMRGEHGVNGRQFWSRLKEEGGWMQKPHGRKRMFFYPERYVTA